MTTRLDRLAPLRDEMTRWRRDFHAHPEIGLEEHRTARAIAARLEEFEIPTVRGVGGTGVVGVIEGRRGPGPRLALRADMDALPLTEVGEGRPHASRVAGTAHACGHDGHMAIALGAARYLSRERNFAGTATLIFQPGEEGRGGAARMVADGLFERFPVDAVFGLHVWPELPKGEIAVHRGPVMASCDSLTITVRGRGGHAAAPHRVVDPVQIAGNIVTASQGLVARGVDPFDAAVLAITGLDAGTAFNIVPAEARLTGTLRGFSAPTRDRLVDELTRLVDGIARAYGGTADAAVAPRARAVVNDPWWSDRAAEAAARALGADRVRRDLHPSMTAEDFSALTDGRPGVYAWLGHGGDRGLHDPAFDVDDDVLVAGAAYWAALIEGGAE